MVVRGAPGGGGGGGVEKLMWEWPFVARYKRSVESDFFPRIIHRNTTIIVTSCRHAHMNKHNPYPYYQASYRGAGMVPRVPAVPRARRAPPPMLSGQRLGMPTPLLHTTHQQAHLLQQHQFVWEPSNTLLSPPPWYVPALFYAPYIFEL